MADRRQHERLSCTDKIVLQTTGKDHPPVEMSLYLRDISEGGLSGTYFNSSVPTVNDTFRVETGFLYGSRELQLVWNVQSIQSVHMLGFRYVN
jgi:hypothetical protein